MDLEYKRIFYDHDVSKDYLKKVQEHKLEGNESLPYFFYMVSIDYTFTSNLALKN